MRCNFTNMRGGEGTSRVTRTSRAAGALDAAVSSCPSRRDSASALFVVVRHIGGTCPTSAEDASKRETLRMAIGCSTRPEQSQQADTEEVLICLERTQGRFTRLQDRLKRGIL